jgi:hypothetical protein
MSIDIQNNFYVATTKKISRKYMALKRPIYRLQMASKLVKASKILIVEKTQI